MNPTIPWTVAGNVTMEELAQKSLEIWKPMVTESTYDKLIHLPVSTLNAICIKMFNNIAPEGFAFGFYAGEWGFHKSILNVVSAFGS